MHSFVFQKIALGKDREVTSLSWNKENDIIAAGFNTKTIKLIKISEPADLEAEIQLCLNQTISSSHKAPITTVSWNQGFDKLLSVDAVGLMVVWTEGGPNVYTEEMVNEAGKRRIKFAKWSSGGSFVIIAIEGGSVILGSVEGERLWGKEVQMEIEFVSFLENDQVILIGDARGGLIALDHRQGEIFAEYDFCDESDSKENGHNIVFFEANNSLSHGRLAIGFKSGKIYFVHDLRENHLKKYDFGIQQIFAAKWSHDGKLLAVGCLMEQKPRILFLDKSANVISCLNTNKSVLHLDFNFAGDRLLAGFQSSLSLIKVKRPFRYGFMQREGVFVAAFEMKAENGPNIADCKNQRTEHLVYYIDLETLCFARIESEGLIFLLSDEDKTILVTTNRSSKNASVMTITDKRGNFLYSVKLKCVPEHVAMKNSRVLFSVNCCVGIWDLSDACKAQIQTRGIAERPRLYWFSLRNANKISDCTLVPESIFESELNAPEARNLNIACVEIAESFYAVCTVKGIVQRFSVNNFSEGEKLVLVKVPRRISINKSETTLVCFDSYNNIDVSLTKSILQSPGNYKPCFSTENATDFNWSQNGTEFCFSKKHKVYEQSLTNFIENSQANGKRDDKTLAFPNCENEFCPTENAFKIGKTASTIIGYHVMNIHCVDIGLLDKVIQEESDFPPLQTLEAFSSFKSTKLKIIDSMINETEAMAKSPENQETVKSEESIWTNLTEYLSKQKDQLLYNYAAQRYLQLGLFHFAEKLYIQLENYTALKFIERIRNGLENETVKKAEALLFTRKPSEAIALLVSKNLSSLVPKLLLAYGEPTGVIEFLSQLDINQQNQVLREIGETHISKNQLEAATKIFERLDDKFTLMHLYFSTQNFEKLYAMITEAKSKEVLLKLADFLVLAGNADLASRALEKAGESKRAVDIAILGNYWSTAVEISERSDFRQIEAIIHRSAVLLGDRRKKLELAELYRKAKKNAEASKILNSLAADLIGFSAGPLLVKKVFVLAALEVLLHGKKGTDPNVTANLTNLTLAEMTRDLTKRAMTTLITSDLNSAGERVLTNPWRGAEAWHFFILAIRLLRAHNFRQALKVGFKLANFELELGEARIYAVLAVAAFYAGFLKSFSRAVSRLERVYTANGNSEMLGKLERLTVQVFMEKAPEDEELDNIAGFDCIAKNCAGKINEFDTFCKVCGSSFSTCLSSGNSIFVKEYVKCNVCKQKVLSSEVVKRDLKHCPLCHTKLKETNR